MPRNRLQVSVKVDARQRVWIRFDRKLKGVSISPSFAREFALSLLAASKNALEDQPSVEVNWMNRAKKKQPDSFAVEGQPNTDIAMALSVRKKVRHG